VRLALERYHTASGERRVRVSSEGKPSRTDFEVLAAGSEATLVRAHLHSGRTHQIRVHAQASGHPVVGDEKYASPEQQALATARGIKRLCLHAETLVFQHGERRLRLSAPLPEDFQVAWTALS
jgi:23S rRNA pseudouridine955/2504/2580 synthase